MSNIFDTEEKYLLVLWSAEWCIPCKSLKDWIRNQDKFNGSTINDKDIIFKDVDKHKASLPIGIKSVPTLQDGSLFITGVKNIQNYLVEYE
jgi:thiol-disulfide isomerase/thioredoxin|tara:strand:- start:699 stop:971 length:273 start_codon:yes stop_codon:yes gene_type:complete